ncbi:hypothetical protein [Achromobacter animicus]|uniref:hypothetical protein n=1 Tax=Achromobacter animicus TaxID=1389935 RepID=UPI0028A64700|nr:hypothetical protein [Achromobacter animicus]
MKKALIALALSACSGMAFAKPVPPFEVHCTDTSANRIAFAAKWDGQVLRTHLRGHTLEWKIPEALYFEMPLEDPDTRGLVEAGFRTEESRVSREGGRKGQKTYWHFTISLLTNTAGRAVQGTYRAVEFNDGIVVNASARPIGACRTELKL